jgi:hypothetical protein
METVTTEFTLWTVRGPIRDVSCTAKPDGGALALIVRYGDEAMLRERYGGLGPLVTRAEELRTRMVNALSN